MEDLLWTMTQVSRTLQDLRKELRGIWQDESARALNGRYLDPHEIEDQQILTELTRQKDSLDQSKAKLASTENAARQVEEYRTFIAEGLESSEQALQSVFENYETYAGYNSEVHAKLSEIKQLIAQANSACIGQE